MTELLTLAEVAEQLRMPEATLRYWRHMKKGPRSIKVGRRVLYSRAEVEAYIQQALAGGDPNAA